VATEDQDRNPAEEQQQEDSPAQEQEQSSAEDREREPLSEEDRTPVEELTTLGLCRYCENDATQMASHKDGTGWVGICDEHEQKARDDDFVPKKEADSSVS